MAFTDWFSSDRELSDIVAPLKKVFQDLSTFSAKKKSDAAEKDTEAKAAAAAAASLLDEASQADLMAGDLQKALPSIIQ